MRRVIVIAAAVAILVVTAATVYALRVASDASVGAAAMAKVVCSCVFVDERALDACRRDDPPGFETIPVTIEASSKTATSTLFGIVSRRATYREETGCTLDP